MKFTEVCRADVTGEATASRCLLQYCYRHWEPSAFCYSPPYLRKRLLNVYGFRVRVY